MKASSESGLWAMRTSWLMARREGIKSMPTPQPVVTPVGRTTPQ